MRHRITTRVRRNVVGYLALFVALAGTSAAAAGLKPSDGQGVPAPPAGAAGPGNIGARARFTKPVVAKHGGWTDISLTGNTWTQDAQDLELVAGTMVVKTPATCTGALGNALVLSVDGTATTFAAAPTSPASSKLTVPFVVGTLTEPGRSTQHKLSARFG